MLYTITTVWWSYSVHWLSKVYIYNMDSWINPDAEWVLKDNDLDRENRRLKLSGNILEQWYGTIKVYGHYGLDMPHYWAASEHIRCHSQASYLPHFLEFCKSQGSDFFTGWWLMYNDYASSPSPYNVVIQFIIIATKHTQITWEVTLWEKLINLWLPDSPKWTTQISYNIQLSNILRKYPHFLLLITCWTSVPIAQPTTHKNQKILLGMSN